MYGVKLAESLEAFSYPTGPDGEGRVEQLRVRTGVASRLNDDGKSVLVGEVEVDLPYSNPSLSLLAVIGEYLDEQGCWNTQMQVQVYDDDSYGGVSVVGWRELEPEEVARATDRIRSHENADRERALAQVARLLGEHDIADDVKLMLR